MTKLKDAIFQELTDLQEFKDDGSYLEKLITQLYDYIELSKEDNEPSDANHTFSNGYGCALCDILNLEVKE